jgi:hypothetical protein
MNHVAEAPMAPRDRTLRHLERILLTSAGSVVLGACEPGQSVVCDPMPPPAITCSDSLDPADVASVTYVAAQWLAVDSDLVVEVNLYFYDDGKKLLLGGKPEIDAGDLVTLEKKNPRGIRFEILPDKGAAEVRITLPATCDTFVTEIVLFLDLSEEASEGGTVPVSFGEASSR